MGFPGLSFLALCVEAHDEPDSTSISMNITTLTRIMGGNIKRLTLTFLPVNGPFRAKTPLKPDITALILKYIAKE